MAGLQTVNCGAEGVLRSSKLKVNRELQLPQNPSFVGISKYWNRRTLHAIGLIQSEDVSVVEKVERLHDEVQLPMLTDLEEFQHAQVQLCLLASPKKITTWSSWMWHGETFSGDARFSKVTLLSETELSPSQTHASD
jgi:hypothetical protein